MGKKRAKRRRVPLQSSGKNRQLAQVPAVLTIDELAVYVQTEKSTTYKLAQEGQIPGVMRVAIGGFTDQRSIVGSPKGKAGHE